MDLFGIKRRREKGKAEKEVERYRENSVAHTDSIFLLAGAAGKWTALTGTLEEVIAAERIRIHIRNLPMPERDKYPMVWDALFKSDPRLSAARTWMWCGQNGDDELTVQLLARELGEPIAAADYSIQD